jgi:hypothetical protein
VGRPIRIAVAVVLLTATGIGTTGSIASARDAAGRLPVLFPVPQHSIESDTPAPVRTLIEREQQALLARAKAAAKLPATPEAGCVRVTDVPGANPFGPPSPAVRARIIGHHVEVLFAYRQLPSSDACRPAFLEVAAYSGRKASSTYNNAGATGTYAVEVSQGRVVVDLPWRGHAPYHLIVRAATIVGRRGTGKEIALACPRSGCLRGYVPASHTWPLPKPVLAVRGVTRTTLEASLQYVIAGERWPSARSASCSSLRSCTVLLADPAYPQSPYRVRYRIAGEQLSGCWMAIQRDTLDPLPYQDAGRGPLELAGCLSWLR